MEDKLEITSNSVGYSKTLESKTGGTITVENLEEARYEIVAAAMDEQETVILTGANHADVYVGEVTYVEIQLEYVFGNLDIVLTFPEQDNLCTLELEGILLDESIPVKVMNGPAILIERLLGGQGIYTPGTASMRTFSIETSGENAATLKTWVDGFVEPISGSLIVYDLQGSESYRWNMLEISPLRYETDSDDNTRFDLTVEGYYEIPNPPYGLSPNYNQETDKGIEISGVTTTMQAIAREDQANNTLTLIFDYEHGFTEAYLWVAEFVAGVGTAQGVSVITWGPGGVGDEESRRNYFSAFPIRFEQIDGFSTDVKGRFRLVLSFDQAQDG